VLLGQGYSTPRGAVIGAYGGGGGLIISKIKLKNSKTNLHYHFVQDTSSLKSTRIKLKQR
jgi:hypothetical protein